MEMGVLPLLRGIFTSCLILPFLDQKRHISHFAIEFVDLQKEYWKF